MAPIGKGCGSTSRWNVTASRSWDNRTLVGHASTVARLATPRWRSPKEEWRGASNEAQIAPAWGYAKSPNHRDACHADAPYTDSRHLLTRYVCLRNSIS